MCKKFFCILCPNVRISERECNVPDEVPLAVVDVFRKMECRVSCCYRCRLRWIRETNTKFPWDRWIHYAERRGFNVNALMNAAEDGVDGHFFEMNVVEDEMEDETDDKTDASFGVQMGESIVQKEMGKTSADWTDKGWINVDVRSNRKRPCCGTAGVIKRRKISENNMWTGRLKEV